MYQNVRLPPKSSGKEKKRTLLPIKGTRKKWRSNFGYLVFDDSDLKAKAKPIDVDHWKRRMTRIANHRTKYPFR